MKSGRIEETRRGTPQLLTPDITQESDLILKEASVRMIKDVLRCGSGADVVLLLGESGSARTSALKVLCKAAGLELWTESRVEQEERQAQRYEQGYQSVPSFFHSKMPKLEANEPNRGFVERDPDVAYSQAQLVDLVFQYAADSTKKAFLIRFLPDNRGFDWFRSILKIHYGEPRTSACCPVFFSISREVEGAPVFIRRLQEESHQYHFNLHEIRCYATETAIVKALHRKIEFNQDIMRVFKVRLGKQKADELLKDIVRDSLNNIHLATASLQILVQSVYRSSQSQSTEHRLRQMRQLCGDNIFHKIGKVLYNKRLVDLRFVPKQDHKDAIKKGNHRYEGDAFDKTKHKMYFRPEDLVESLHSGRGAFKLMVGIQTNYPQFCGKMHDCANIAAGIARMDHYLGLFKRFANQYVSEEEMLKISVQYVYNFMNKSRYPGNQRVKVGVDSINFKSTMKQHRKLSNRQLDEMMYCPELKCLLQNSNPEPKKGEPVQIDDDISSDSDEEGPTLVKALLKNQLDIKKPDFKVPPLFKFEKPSSQQKLSSNAFSSQCPKIERRIIEEEIGDQVSLSSDSFNEEVLDQLEREYYSMRSHPTESQLWMNNEARNFDLEYDDLSQLMSSSKI